MRREKKELPDDFFVDSQEEKETVRAVVGRKAKINYLIKHFPHLCRQSFFYLGIIVRVGLKRMGFFSSQVVSSLVDSVHSCRYSANLVSRALFTVVQWKGSGCHNRSKIFDISWSPLTPNCFTLTSVCIFSILFFTHFLRC